MTQTSTITGPNLRLTPFFLAGPVMRFSIYRLDNLSLVGILLVVLIDPETQLAMLELLISSPEKRRLYGPESIQLALQYVFGVRRYRRVTVRIPEYDGATISLIEQTGFVLEARQQQAVFLRGRFWDNLLFSLYETDWQVRLQYETLSIPLEGYC